MRLDRPISSDGPSRRLDSAPRARHGARDGFSLLEVVIAMGILAFGLLTLALAQVYALRQGAEGRHTGDAAAAARTYVEQAQRVPWSVLSAALGGGWRDPDWASAPGTWSKQLVDASGEVLNEHVYDVDWRVTALGGTACLRQVEVRVAWSEQDRPAPKQLVLATRRYDWGGAGC